MIWRAIHSAMKIARQRPNATAPAVMALAPVLYKRRTLAGLRFSRAFQSLSRLRSVFAMIGKSSARGKSELCL